MAYPVRVVANSIIKKAREHDSFLTPLKLQKLVFLSQGVTLGAFGVNHPIVKEQIEAWQFGPVVKSLYSDLAKYGKEPILDPFIKPSPQATLFREETSLDYIPEGDSDSIEIIDVVWNQYGHFSANELVALTHRRERPEGFPWNYTWNDLDGKNRPGTDIDSELIAEHFRKIVSKT